MENSLTPSISLSLSLLHHFVIDPLQINYVVYSNKMISLNYSNCCRINEEKFDLNL